MKIVYLNCHYGVTPSKFLSAIIDTGVKKNLLIEEMKKLGIPFEMKVRKEEKGQFKGTYIALKTQEKKSPVTLKEIINLINLSNLESDIKNKIKFIFNKIAEAESEVHKEPKEKVLLYEVGQPKAILTVAGIMSGLKKLKIARLYCSEISTGYGKVKCSHGILSIPTPATSVLMRGIPVFPSNIRGELTTPLGIAIVLSLAEKFGKPPPMSIEKIGCGFGLGNGEVASKPLTVCVGSKI